MASIRARIVRTAGQPAAFVRGCVPAPKWIPLGIGIGSVSGAMAILLYWSVARCTDWLLGSVGYHPATVAGDVGGFHQASGFAHPWAIPLIVAGGAFVAAVLVFWIAPETEGHGTDVAIRSINEAPDKIRFRVMPVKMIASAITIGSGGSGGSEGPTAQMAVAFPSFIAHRFNFSYQDARIAVTSGLAAGVGAIFRAPLGGAMLGAELLFRKDSDPAMFVPSLIASGVAYAEFGAVNGYAPMFGHLAGMHLALSAQLLIFPVLGLCCGLLGRLYTAVFYGVTAFFKRWPGYRPIRVGVAGLATGALGLAIPGVLGTGYGTIQYVTSPQRVLHLSLLVLIAMPFGKILGTSLSIGSGGSGGVFGPGMVVGATAGALLWRLASPHGLAPLSPAALVILGMAACLGAAAHSPVAITLIAVETCGSYWLLLAALITVPLAVYVMGPKSLYRNQLTDRAELAARRAAVTASADTPAVDEKVEEADPAHGPAVPPATPPSPDPHSRSFASGA
jgi:chloride channel protein, CIC family